MSAGQLTPFYELHSYYCVHHFLSITHKAVFAETEKRQNNTRVFLIRDLSAQCARLGPRARAVPPESP